MVGEGGVSNRYKYLFFVVVVVVLLCESLSPKSLSTF